MFKYSNYFWTQFDPSLKKYLSLLIFVKYHLTFNLFSLFLKVVRQLSQESGMGDYESENDENDLDLDGKPEVSSEKLENLVKRQKVYGDITQNASPEELETLLRYHENKVPEVSLFHNRH